LNRSLAADKKRKEKIYLGKTVFPAEQRTVLPITENGGSDKMKKLLMRQEGFTAKKCQNNQIQCPKEK
jgi:hypothetical protein